MKNLTLGLFAVVAVGLGIVYGLVRIRSEMGLGNFSAIASTVAEKHQVSTRMRESSQANQGKPAPSFREVASDGRIYECAELIKNGPFIVIFIKESCPCSEEAEPFFQRLQAAVAGQIKIVGVIEGSLATAETWVKQHQTPYPILPDPESRIIRGFGAENSAYVALVNSQGLTERLWPGYSAEMLKELVGRAGVMVGQPLGPIDVSGAPGELYSGCPYF